MLATRICMLAKRSTGLVGLAYNENAISDLVTVYKNQLAAVQSIPEQLNYRLNIEANASYRIRLLESGANVSNLTYLWW